MTKCRDITPTAPRRDPTPREAQAIEIAKASQAERPSRAKLVLEGEGSSKVFAPPHGDLDGWAATLRETFGTASNGFMIRCMMSLQSIVHQCGGGEDQTALGAALAMIAGFSPANEAEAGIAVQIVVNHVASIHLMSRAMANANTSHVEAAASYMGMCTKASRTMVGQIEALAKLRGGGKQIIEHRYYQVNATNAVVGDHAQSVFGPPGEKLGNGLQSHEPWALEHAPGTTLPSAQSAGEPVPVPGDAGPEALSPSWREEPRRSKG